MMTKGLSIIVAILAIAAGAEAKKKNKPPKTCEEQTKCDKCLTDDGCAWWVGNDGEQKCVTASKCLPIVTEDELFDGQCYAGSTFPDIKKSCRRMKRGKPPVKCKTYNGKGNCYECLTNGCDWEVEKQKCVKKPSDKPSNDRKLLSFLDPASAQCYFYGIEYGNIQKCEASDDDCSACVTTPLTRSMDGFDDDPYVIPSFCGYQEGTGKCVPGNTFPDGGRKTCGNNPDEDCDRQWPSLVNKELFAVEAYLKSLGLDVALCQYEPQIWIDDPPDKPDFPYLPDDEIYNPPTEYPISDITNWDPAPVGEIYIPTEYPISDITNWDPEPPVDFVLFDSPPEGEEELIPHDNSGRRNLLSVNGDCYTEDFRCDRVRLFYDGIPNYLEDPDFKQQLFVKLVPQVG